ncbi:MAG: radical SAM protein [Bacillota bacterium]
MYHLLFATNDGKVYDYPAMAMAGRLGNAWAEPEEAEMIPLPRGATLTMIPGRHPVGIETAAGKFRPLVENPYASTGLVWAVGALLPQGYTRTLLPGFTLAKRGDPALPLLGYAAVGMKKGKYYVAALKTDRDYRWNPSHYNTPELPQLVEQRLAANPENRILKELAKCSLNYGCFTAQNIFYRRWEGGLPVSPACNARCLGCISKQPAECCPSPQERLSFVPSIEEIAEVAVHHLTASREAIISCGQGCEGEPALRAKEIGAAVMAVRARTASGTFNINTNGGYTEGIRLLCRHGVDSFRVSLNSARPQVYQAYYRPKNYTFNDVAASLKAAAEAGVYASLNLLAFPGVTDREEEVEALVKLAKETRVKMIQVRNLNIDPDRYLDILPPAKGEVLGVPRWLAVLRAELPGVEIGNFSRPVR